MMKVLFFERQRFSSKWLWLLLGIITLIPVYGIYKQIFIGKPFGDNPMSDVGLILMLILMLSILVLFRVMQLKTEITKRTIKIQYFPFFKTQFHWSDIKSSEVVNYGFVGYGIRIGTKYGTVYNTSGNKGLAIELKSGKKYCIGTQRDNELKAVVDQLNIDS